MKRLLLPVLLFGASLELFAELELTGIFHQNSILKFCLRESGASITSDWVSLGDEFAGYKLESYEADTSTLIISKSGSKVSLRLLSAKATSGAPPLTAEERIAVSRKIVNNLRQIAAAADQYYLEYGVMTVKLDQLVGPDKYIRKLVPVDGEDYSILRLSQGCSFEIVSARGVHVSYTP